MRSLLTCLVFVVACGAPARPPPATTSHAATGAAPVVESRPATGPSEQACDALLGHALGIVIASRQPPPTEADRTALRAELRDPFIADCRAGTRAYHRCGLAAKTQDDLAACKPDAQRTPRSSTSNSSVAPGGMTPAAPRSP